MANRWPRLNPTVRRVLLRLFVGLLVAYFAFGGYIFWAMHQPPESFARVMARLPGPVPFLLFPFETLWTKARAGALNPGDQAPDFTLQKQDKSGTVQFAALNKQRPVVLIFGSYT
jgi:hypothetical protein